MKVKNLFRFVGILILLYLLIKLDLNSLLKTIKNINMIYFLIGILLSVPMLFIKTMRFDYLTTSLHKKYKENLFIMYFFTLALGIFTPVKIGELSRVYYLKKNGASGRKSFFIVFADRIFDVITFSFFGVLSMLLFTHYFIKEIIFLFFMIAIGVLALALIYIFRKSLFKLVLNKFDRE